MVDVGTQKTVRTVCSQVLGQQRRTSSPRLPFGRPHCIGTKIHHLSLCCRVLCLKLRNNGFLQGPAWAAKGDPLDRQSAQSWQASTPQQTLLSARTRSRPPKLLRWSKQSFTTICLSTIFCRSCGPWSPPSARYTVLAFLVPLPCWSSVQAFWHFVAPSVLTIVTDSNLTRNARLSHILTAL